MCIVCISEGNIILNQKNVSWKFFFVGNWLDDEKWGLQTKIKTVKFAKTVPKLPCISCLLTLPTRPYSDICGKGVVESCFRRKESCSIFWLNITKTNRFFFFFWKTCADKLIIIRPGACNETLNRIHFDWLQMLFWPNLDL